MPRNRLLARIDEELLQARESLKFWRDQILLLDDRELQLIAQRQIKHCEVDIRELLNAQELLIGPDGSGHRAAGS